MTDSSGTPIDNPWRESIENVIEGTNYLRVSEWQQLLGELDRLYLLERELAALRSEGERLREALREQPCWTRGNKGKDCVYWDENCGDADCPRCAALSSAPPSEKKDKRDSDPKEGP